MRIRRGLSSRHLPCGCLAGIYETYRDEIVAIVDARGERCGHSAHQPGYVLPTPYDATANPSEHVSPRG